jgi:hypothetical protein
LDTQWTKVEIVAFNIALELGKTIQNVNIRA